MTPMTNNAAGAALRDLDLFAAVTGRQLPELNVRGRFDDEKLQGDFDVFRTGLACGRQEVSTVCETCNSSGEVETGIGMMVCDACNGDGHQTCAVPIPVEGLMRCGVCGHGQLTCNSCGTGVAALAPKPAADDQLTPTTSLNSDVLNAVLVVVRAALDDRRSDVHVCDRDNDDLVVRECSPEVQALYASLKAAGQIRNGDHHA